MRGPGGDFDSSPSAFLRIESHPRWLRAHRVAATLIEIDGDGMVPRQVDLGVDGRPLAVTGPDRCTDFSREVASGSCPKAPPGTAEFDDFWAPMGDLTSRDEFESVYARAVANAPNSFREGGLARWIGSLGCLGPVAVVVVLLVALAVQPVGLLTRFIRRLRG